MFVITPSSPFKKWALRFVSFIKTCFSGYSQGAEGHKCCCNLFFHSKIPLSHPPNWILSSIGNVSSCHIWVLISHLYNSYVCQNYTLPRNSVKEDAILFPILRKQKDWVTCSWSSNSPVRARIQTQVLWPLVLRHTLWAIFILKNLIIWMSLLL